jgi:hypothetical protein
VIALHAAAVARADSAVLLPHAGERQLLAEREQAHRSVANALREAGLELRTQGPSSGAAKANACAQVSCAGALLKQLDAELAVALAVWQADGDIEVHVTIVDAGGGHYPGRALVAPGADAAQAARIALTDAQSLQLLGPGPWVAVSGEPKGAAVWIDGRFVGSLPYRAGVAPGDHDLEVRADGHMAKQMDLRVPLEPTATARIDVALEAARSQPLTETQTPSAAPTTAPAVFAPQVDREGSDRRTTGSPWNYVIGGALVAVGGALVVVNPVRAAARDGRCADPECERVYNFGTRSALELVAGIALVGAGVTALIWQPLRVETEVGPDRALVRTRLAF